LPFGHPWISKIENGLMNLQEAIDRIKGSDNYTYKLNEANIKKKVASSFVTATNLNEEQLTDISYRCSHQDYKHLLSNPNGILNFKEFLSREITDDDFY
jgi:hypothetical protein